MHCTTLDGSMALTSCAWCARDSISMNTSADISSDISTTAMISGIIQGAWYPSIGEMQTVQRICRMPCLPTSLQLCCVSVTCGSEVLD